jgi:hypothetical protein
MVDSKRRVLLETKEAMLLFSMKNTLATRL